MNNTSMQAGSDVSRTGSENRWRRSGSHRVYSDRLRTSYDTPIDIRLRLQRKAENRVLRHLLRTVARITTLATGDLIAFAVMRTAIRAVRDWAILGAGIADTLQAVLPKGVLNGGQYVIGLMLALFVMGNYRHGDARRDARRLFAAAALATALTLWNALWVQGFDFVASQFAITTCLVFAGILGNRLLIDALVARFQWSVGAQTPTLFIGTAQECRAAMTGESFTTAEFRITGFVDLDQPPAPDSLGHVADFETLLQRSGADNVVICGYLSDESLREVADSAFAAGCQLLSVSRATRVAGVQPVPHVQRGRTLIELRPARLRGEQRMLKRLLDVVGATIALILAAPLLLIVGLAVKLSSEGPMLFSQERVGSGGRRFRLLKFRTMYHNADDSVHREYVTRLLRGEESPENRDRHGNPVFKLTSDARVTPLGRFLRATSLDELPQFFNVLLGQMSLVGPRPPLPYEVDQYDHWQFQRLQCRPGITGLWQVSGRNRLTYRQMCEIDVDYVRRWSLWLDLQILARTIPVVLRNSGSAH